MSTDFWEWVCTRRAHDNPQGDFIRDTRDLLNRGKDPDAHIVSACSEARVEHYKLKREWEREMSA